MPSTSSENLANSTLANWMRLLIGSLVEAGVRSAVISPGSRSTPIVLAAQARQDLNCFLLVDERSAAFFALGQARMSGRPSLLICTSGTAAANYYPAVIEAKESGLPLLILSADRPSELQYCGAPQTLDQLKLFGAFATFIQLAEASVEKDAKQGLRRTLRAGVSRSVSNRPGPVHFNFQVRKPLEFSQSKTDSQDTEAQGSDLLVHATGATTTTTPVASLVRKITNQLRQARHPLVIAGAFHSGTEHTGTESLSEALDDYLEASDSLLCPETVSQLRLRQTPRRSSRCLDAFDWLFSEHLLDPHLQPDFILQIGSAPLSSGLQRLLKRYEYQLPIVVCSEGAEADAFHRNALVLDCSATALLKALSEQLRQHDRVKREWTPWQRHNRVAWQCVREVLEGEFTECGAVTEVISKIPIDSCLMVGNSLAPRHLDRYCSAQNSKVFLGSQRGASGIEGAVASALGAATVFSGPVTLLVGDVSFLHDLGGLWAGATNRLQCQAFQFPVVVLILNNGGGRIFEQLPVAQNAEVPLQWWTSPHDIQFSGLAKAFGLAHSQVKTREALSNALTVAYAHLGVSIVEVFVPESGSQQTAQAVESLLRERLSQTTSPSDFTNNEPV